VIGKGTHSSSLLTRFVNNRNRFIRKLPNIIIPNYPAYPSGRAAARLLGLRARIPPGLLWVLCCQRCVGLITHPEESYRVWCLIVIVKNRWGRPKPTRGCRAMEKPPTPAALPRDLPPLFMSFWVAALNLSMGTSYSIPSVRVRLVAVS